MPDIPGGAGSEADASASQAPKKKKSTGKRKTKQGSQTPPEVQAQIIAALLSGQFTTDKEIAVDVGVSVGLVSKMKKSIPEEFLEQVRIEKKDKIGELVASFLENALESLIRIDAITHDNDWLKAQDAPGLATFYGVKADKVIKILEAIERANEKPEDTVPLTESAEG